MLKGVASKEALEKNERVLTEQPVENQSEESEIASVKGPMQFMFESEVDCIFTTPLGA